MPAKISPPTVWEGLKTLATVIRSTEREIDHARRLDVFNVADAPSAEANAFTLIYVPDESGGPALAFSDGTNWLRVTLGPPIS